MANWYQQNANQIVLQVYVQPGAKQTELAGFHGDALKIRLRAPPVEGRANEALLQFIAQSFAVSTRQVVLQRGAKSRFKTLLIHESAINPEHLI